MARVGRNWWEVAWLLRFRRSGPHDQAERLKGVWATFGPRRRPLHREAGRAANPGAEPTPRPDGGRLCPLELAPMDELEPADHG